MGATDERCARHRIWPPQTCGGHRARGVGRRERPPVESARCGFEGHPIRFGQSERIGEEDHGVPAGSATDTPLDIADAARADARAFRQFILRQIGGEPETVEYPAESLG
jgi:hypothetical protein